MEVAINERYGGFGLSTKALMLYCERKYGEAHLYLRKSYDTQVFKRVPNDYYEKNNTPTDRLYVLKQDAGEEVEYNDCKDIILFNHQVCSYDNRTDPLLISVIKELGSEANGDYAEIHIVDVPDDVKWHISEYDGMETVEEDHRSWY